MGWIDRMKDIIGRARASGKNEEEVKAIIQQAADEATVTTAIKETQSKVAAAFGVPEKVLRDMPYIDEWKEYERQMAAVAYASRYVGTAARITTAKRRESNNYRKMHGLPMKRTWRRAKHGAGRGYGYR